MPAAPSWPRAVARAARASLPEVLDAAHRMLRSDDFAVAVRSGVRSGNRRIVVHYRAGETGDTSPALVGVVVPKKQVARATHRNRIKRRLRAGADGASSRQLGADVDHLLARCRDLSAQGRRR